jgi:glycosyltransferase involved in cell wall biosynthesis
VKPKITTHTIIKNEDRWIWYALMSVINQVDKMLIYDTGSTDKTIQIIKAINSPKIILKEKGSVDRKKLVRLRQEQIRRTKTPWFMLLDGDEIWPQKNLKKLTEAASKANKNTIALFNHTRNCVGDIFHYLPASKGRYQIKDKQGHLNIRLIRNLPDIKVSGEYPLETYTLKGQPIQEIEDRIQFVDIWYLHTTHLSRSTQPQTEEEVIDRLKKRKFRLGVKMDKDELPEIFWQPRPEIVPPPITSRWQELFK